MSNSQPTSPPLTGDASFGLDPSADVDHSIEGKRWIPRINDVTARLVPGHALGGHHHHRHHDQRQHSTSSSARHSREVSREGRSVSSTRSRRETSGAAHDGTPPSHRRSSASTQSVDSSDNTDTEATPQSSDTTRPNKPPTGSLTLSFFTPGLSLTRRLSLLGSSIFINMFLPFVNGTMLGVGEVVARGVIWPMVGIGIGAGMRFLRKSPGAQ